MHILSFSLQIAPDGSNYQKYFTDASLDRNSYKYGKWLMRLRNLSLSRREKFIRLDRRRNRLSLLQFPEFITDEKVGGTSTLMFRIFLF